MKYRGEIKTVDGHTFEVRVKHTDIPKDTPIWACDYDINNDTKNRRLSCKPVQGEVTEKNSYHIQFREYSKKTGELKSSGVRYFSRVYADTYEECIELYNELVQKRIDNLKKILEEAEADKI